MRYCRAARTRDRCRRFATGRAVGMCAARNDPGCPNLSVLRWKHCALGTSARLFAHSVEAECGPRPCLINRRPIELIPAAPHSGPNHRHRWRSIGTTPAPGGSRSRGQVSQAKALNVPTLRAGLSASAAGATTAMPPGGASTHPAQARGAGFAPSRNRLSSRAPRGVAVRSPVRGRACRSEVSACARCAGTPRWPCRMRQV